MTSVLPIACLALVIFSIVLSWVGWWQLKSFSSNCTSIRSRNDIEQFKAVVKWNMYFALTMLACIGLAVVLAIASVVTGAMSWPTLLIALVVIGPVFGIGGFFQTATEKKVKAMEIEDVSLKEEFEQVVSTWVGKALPNW